METINDRVKILRKELGLTLEKFGEKLGVGKNAISRIETKKNGVTDQMKKSICREFNVDYIWLTTGEGEIFLNSEINISFKERIIGAVTVMDESTAKKVWNFIENIFKEKNI